MPEAQSILKVRCPACSQKLDMTGLSPFTRIPCPACGDELIVPRRFGSILLEEPIGSGGMATVYRALDLTLDREVAVKILNARIVEHPEWVALFLNEARSTAALNHPNVVPIYSCGEWEGQPYLVMQYMPGLSLDRHLREAGGPLPPEFTLRAAADAARGLDAAYRHGIVHHDVKPGNILTDADGNVKIGDFGLAQILRDDTAPSIDDIVKGWGSPSYVSPEKLNCGRGDHRSDVYSLGASLYHMLTGQPPYGSKSTREVVAKLASGERPEPPNRLCPTLSAALSQYVMLMMHHDPALRPMDYETVAETLDAFRKDLRKSQLMRKKIGAHKRLSQVAAQRLGQGPSPASPRPMPPRSPLRAWTDTLLLLALFLLIVLSFVTVRRRPPWYVRTVEPRVEWLRARARTWLPNRDDDAAARATIAVSESVADTAPSPAPAPAPSREKIEATGGDMAVAALFETSPLPSSRPRPADLNMTAIRKQLQEYLNPLPWETQIKERERLLYLNQSRPYLMQLINRMPYSAETPLPVRLGDGTMLHGTVASCNEDGFMVRSHEPGVAPRLVPWADLAIEQYVRFFDFYIVARLERGTAESGASTNRRDAAEDCLRVTVLCDWYGYPAAAAAYARRASELAPEQRQRLVELVPEAARF